MNITYIALGSNLNHPVSQLHAAERALAQLPDSVLVQVSSFYQNPPYGPPQPDFINAVAELHTNLTAQDLLSALRHIENQQGRVRTPERNGPRTLDLDIILYGQEIIQNEELSIPHPHFLERPFVLIPLYEIAPDLILPNGKALQNYIRAEDYQDLKRI